MAPVGERLLGRVLDGLGRPIDGGEPLDAGGRYVERRAARRDAAARRCCAGPIDQRLPLGVRALDALIPCGRGQRLGIFAGSGVGKSTLLGMIARNTEADVNVIGLVGERGREVREFVERDLGPEGLAALRARASPPPTSRRSCASSAAETGDDASPSRSATRARTCCC